MPNGPRSILIIDDTPEDRLRCRWLLNQTAFRPLELHEAETGESALRLMESARPDCILLDYGLPDMTGADFLEKMRTQEELRDVAIVAVTGQTNPEVAVQVLKLGAHEYVLKDQMNAAELARAITNARRQAWLNRCLRSKQEEMERFAHTVAHDLRAPLARVATMTELLLESDDPATVRDLCVRIFDNTRRLRTLVDDLLQYAQIVRGGVPRATLELGQVVEVALSNLEEDLRQSSAHVSVGALPAVRGNQTLLLQLFQNLIGNAVKFRSSQTIPEVRVYSETRNGLPVVIVEDNGIGIDPKHHEEIFTPLKRLHPTHKYEGSGIGLATCRKVVEQHNGRIWVESAPGSGAKFCVTLADTTLSEGDGDRVGIEIDGGGERPTDREELDRLDRAA